jgi:hypothetical protein
MTAARAFVFYITTYCYLLSYHLEHLDIATNKASTRRNAVLHNTHGCRRGRKQRNTFQTPTEPKHLDHVIATTTGKGQLFAFLTSLNERPP